MTTAPASASSDSDTRLRLLAAAAEVFAEHGFRAATVRDICTRAEANIAAVHYHFGDKEALYHEVIERAVQAALTAFPPDYGLPPDPTAKDRLHAFVHSFLLRVLTVEKTSVLMRMLTREMVEPTAALDRLVEKVQRPLFRMLHGIVAELSGPHTPPETVLACSQAVVAQCLFYKHAEHVISRMGHRLPATPTEIAHLADQITEFTLGGIERRARASRGDRTS
ncbi:MAG: CerR family C-terminal domain-containing protein [Planctomycetes bacterium]|nr:CerR family C-terminal domain-containing protein [Planctomycetota bacterium]